MANIGETRISGGPVEFALSYRNLDGGKPGLANADQGVCIQVVADVGGTETELLRFDCFDNEPHYHYFAEEKRERLMMDKTTAGNPVGWAMKQLREKLPEMLTRTGHKDLVTKAKIKTIAPKLDELEAAARELAVSERNTVTDKRGDAVVEAGVIRFGLEFRSLANDGGQAIHVLGDVAGQEIELLAFDCFVNEPHYHYGPRAKNERIYWDKTTVPDTLRWTLDQFKDGRLASMIQRAGYPGIASELDDGLIQSKLPEIEAKTKAMAEAAAKSE